MTLALTLPDAISVKVYDFLGTPLFAAQVNGVDVHIQDEGRTIKVFPTDASGVGVATSSLTVPDTTRVEVIDDGSDRAFIGRLSSGARVVPRDGGRILTIHAGAVSRLATNRKS